MVRSDAIVKMDPLTQNICYTYLRNHISCLSAPYFLGNDINSKLLHDTEIYNVGFINADYVMTICVEPNFESMNKIRVILIRKDKLLWLWLHP